MTAIGRFPVNAADVGVPWHFGTFHGASDPSLDARLVMTESNRARRSEVPKHRTELGKSRLSRCFSFEPLGFHQTVAS